MNHNQNNISIIYSRGVFHHLPLSTSKDLKIHIRISAEDIGIGVTEGAHKGEKSNGEFFF
jgi:hypothetical protein